MPARTIRPKAAPNETSSLALHGMAPSTRLQTCAPVRARVSGWGHRHGHLHNIWRCALAFPRWRSNQNHDVACPNHPGIRGVSTTTQENSVLTLPRADSTIRTNEHTATRHENNGKNTPPTLADSKSSHAAPHTKTLHSQVASQLKENWSTMHDTLGLDPLICRPRFTTSAMRTHVYRADVSEASRDAIALCQSTPAVASLLPAVPSQQHCQTSSRASFGLFQSSMVLASSITGTAQPKPQATANRHDVSPAPDMRKPVELPQLLSGNRPRSGYLSIGKGKSTTNHLISKTATTMTATTTLIKMATSSRPR